MRASALLLFVSSALAVPSWATGPTAADLRAVNEQSVCEYPKRAHVVYRGSTEGLSQCLDGAAPGPIAELRISSGGGGAWEALRLMQRYAGRIDLVVVEKLCASSCANYILPAAKRLRVEPESLVLLHGSPNLRDTDPQKAGAMEQMKAGMKATRPEMSAADIEKEAEAAWQRMRDEITDMQPVQQAWASETLRCDDWLDPHRHPDGPPPPGTQWLMVTPEMARRCLKATSIAAYWPPAHDYPPGLGFFRARR